MGLYCTPLLVLLLSGPSSRECGSREAENLSSSLPVHLYLLASRVERVGGGHDQNSSGSGK